MSSEPQVHIVDDDADVRDSLQFLLSSVDVPATTYPSAQAFLDVAEAARGCVVTDIRMPEIDGLELVRRLKAQGVGLPVIVITGHADVPLAVEAMKSGVADFIEKPFEEDAILHAVRQALRTGAESDAQVAERAEIVARRNSLSQREAQVLDGLVLGKANKVIAFDLDISPRTVEIYRAHVMTKMGAKSLSDLVRMVMVSRSG
ncbi:response regulator FixJ [Caulobacter sp. KR2-114]|uniref:response regulator FixJ n=1 Tax=Caulobacter sp. KR2-114 TaxID=3400912 RepID=UPI003C08DD25